jgi:hypothetical protein
MNIHAADVRTLGERELIAGRRPKKIREDSATEAVIGTLSLAKLFTDSRLRYDCLFDFVVVPLLSYRYVLHG